MHNCLPIGQQLRNRNIPASDLCYRCGRFETIEHTFLTCQFVVEVWKKLKEKIGFKRMLKSYVSPRQWMTQTLARCTDKEAILAISFWHIWEARNAMQNGEKEVHPHCVAGKFFAFVDLVLLHFVYIYHSH